MKGTKQVIPIWDHLHNVLSNILLTVNLYDYSRLHPYGGPDNSCIMIHDFVEGDDGEESLHRYSLEIQYEIGYHAGTELKKLHQLAASAYLPSWHTRKEVKHERYCDVFDLEPVHVCIAENIHPDEKSRPDVPA